MTDIFFSYRSTDRERIRPIYDAFVKRGFEVFWDQELPSGVDWDTWIRQHLNKAKCVVVFWSGASVESPNVRHEAAVANLQRKLVGVLVERLSPDQLPMGLYSQQAIDLTDWKGDQDDAEWRKLNRDIESKLTPAWMQGKIYELEAELIAERARREGAENRNRVLESQIAKEVQAQEDLKRERENAVDEMTASKQAVDDRNRANLELESELAAERARREGAEKRNKALQGQIKREVQAQEDLKRQRETVIEKMTAIRKVASERRRANLELDTELAAERARRNEAENRIRALQGQIGELLRAREGLRREREMTIKARAMRELKNVIGRFQSGSRWVAALLLLSLGTFLISTAIWIFGTGDNGFLWFITSVVSLVATSVSFQKL